VIGLAGNGTTAVGVEADVTDRAQLEVCLELIEEALGPVDVLVNNAVSALENGSYCCQQVRAPSSRKIKGTTSSPWRTSAKSKACERAKRPGSPSYI